MNDLGTLVLRDHVLPIREAVLSGWLNTLDQGHSVGLSWNLGIQAQEFELSGEYCEPRVYYEGFRSQVDSWKDLAGLTLAWGPKDEPAASDGPRAVYVWEHGEIIEATLDIGERNGRRFRIRWHGVCQVDGEAEPFALESWATFSGIEVMGGARQTREGLIALLAAETDLSDLRPGVLRESGWRARPGLAGLVDRLRGARPHKVLDFAPAD